jgi:hypothetical protein
MSDIGMASGSSDGFLSSSDFTKLAGIEAAAPSYTVADSPPSTPNVGHRWLKTSTGIEYTWIDDGSNSQWVELGRTAVMQVFGDDNIDGGGPYSTYADAAPIDGGGPYG